MMAKKAFRCAVKFFAALLALSAFSAHAIADLPRANPVPGGIAIVPLAADSEPTPSAYFAEQRVLILRQNGYWQAVIGLPLGLAPGAHSLSFALQNQKREVDFYVFPKKYPAQYLTLQNDRQVNPGPEELQRIVKDQAAITKAFATWTEREITDLRFDAPAVGRLTAGFGLHRFFNNQPRQPHNGLDIAAPLGTPIKAPAAGLVVEIGDYFFTGNTVFIDHGQGLVSMYCHLSKVDVTPGQALLPGEKIGEVGMTGRATGPHLHWAISLNNSRIDPALFLSSANW
ncbi:MAG TPA: peptidoglycan DD-metalloendopeptidase family protein [Acidiferrobacterales bacterium]|nr:peptidoglycan DD-metalloendopeptidase family protein [Acidiferrobacterales bacterium]